MMHRRRFLRQISPQLDVRLLITPKIDKRGRLVGGFESRAAARIERHHRIRLLRSTDDPAANAVADALEACRRRHRCRSLACPLCGRLRRIKKSATALAFLNDYPLSDLRQLTLINPADALPAGELATLEPRKLLTRYRRQFERAGIDKTSSFIIAYLDGEWDEGRNLYQPHLHAIAWQIDQNALKALTDKWPTDVKVRVKKRLEPIDDLPRVVAYLDKTYWPSVARSNNYLGIHPHGKRRPVRDIELEILIWLHTHKYNHLILLFGVKSYGKVLMKT